MTHENIRDCQKCQSVIKNPCFIFNGNQTVTCDTPPETQRKCQIARVHQTTYLQRSKIGLTQLRLLAWQRSNARGVIRVPQIPEIMRRTDVEALNETNVLKVNWLEINRNLIKRGSGSIWVQLSCTQVPRYRGECWCVAASAVKSKRR